MTKDMLQVRLNEFNDKYMHHDLNTQYLPIITTTTADRLTFPLQNGYDKCEEIFKKRIEAGFKDVSYTIHVIETSWVYAKTRAVSKEAAGE
jgi:hypothetical protein